MMTAKPAGEPRSCKAVPRKPAKFRRGQVVCLRNYGFYWKVTLAYGVAEGVGRGMRWWYKVMHPDQLHTQDFPERELRVQTKLEAGR